MSVYNPSVTAEPLRVDESSDTPYRVTFRKRGWTITLLEEEALDLLVALGDAVGSNSG